MILLNEVFINIINQQPELFSPKDREDLIKQAQTWSEDPEAMGDRIYQWTSARKDIYSAALKNLSGKANDHSDRLPGNSTAPKIDPQDYKPMLLNAIHRSFNTTPQTATATSK
jgi:hypothetical protein